jgi:hypothetical protein
MQLGQAAWTVLLLLVVGRELAAGAQSSLLSELLLVLLR